MDALSGKMTVTPDLNFLLDLLPTEIPGTSVIRFLNSRVLIHFSKKNINQRNLLGISFKINIPLAFAQ